MDESFMDYCWLFIFGAAGLEVGPVTKKGKKYPGEMAVKSQQGASGESPICNCVWMTDQTAGSATTLPV